MIIRQYTAAYRSKDGRIIPAGNTMESLESARASAAYYEETPTNSSPMFVAFRDVPDWAEFQVEK